MEIWVLFTPRVATNSLIQFQAALPQNTATFKIIKLNLNEDIFWK